MQASSLLLVVQTFRYIAFMQISVSKKKATYNRSFMENSVLAACQKCTLLKLCSISAAPTLTKDHYFLVWLKPNLCADNGNGLELLKKNLKKGKKGCFYFFLCFLCFFPKHQESDNGYCEDYCYCCACDVSYDVACCCKACDDGW